MKRVLIVILIICSVTKTKGQDFHLSMYDAAPVFLNPSMTGVFDGEWRIHTQYRTQWKAVNFKPYTTGLISFDMPYKKWGFGAQLSNFRAGIGNYNAFQALASAAYTVPIDANKFHNISMGTQFGGTQKSIEYQLHTFDNQYTTTNGGGFDNTIDPSELFAGQSIVIPELNFGAMYYYSKQLSKFNPFIGFSAFNLLTPTETFFSGPNKLPMRFYTHAGVRVNVTEHIFVLPKILVMQQNTFREQTFAIDAGFYLHEAETYLLTGLVYRNRDAISVSVGARKSHYIAKVSYDFNTSTLRPFSTGRGGFEISFTYMKQNYKPKEGKICPRL
ncbi:MAG: PorP/SprF family type IX secretion system membrane protein [Crocinitomicaceae bacterium]|jgi:type IX secretion system PorP/SprF family membrane protein|nr:PorP/SprF family type IX secretion system membrane protein [Crocinitomicaceae bacterium]